jgi:PncC family amidohydrolase
MVDVVTLIEALRAQGLTVAVAESFTGGLVVNRFVEVAGVSDVLSGGACTYSNRSKSSVLGVPAAMIRRNGAVSRQVSLAMAAGARRVFETNYAIATTGIAGPTGYTAEKPLGLSYTAALGPATQLVTRRVLRGPRDKVREAAVGQALHTLGRLLVQDGVLSRADLKD